MIDFKYHLISIVAIFFALAAGIALGSGPLQAQLSERLVEQSDSDRLGEQQARDQLDSANARLDFADAFAGTTSQAVVGSALDGRTVSLVVLPGADPGAVRAMRDEVAAADGLVVSTVTLTEELLDPANRQLAEGLAQRILDGRGSDSADGAVSYQLLGAALSRSFLTGKDGATERDNTANGIEAALDEAGLIVVDGVATRRAQLALVVAGDPVDDAPDGQADVAAEIVSALDSGSAGAVVAGPAASADGGVVAAVRETEAAEGVSSVDALDLAAGRVVTVLALAEQARGGVGQYGMSDAAGAAAPTPTRQ
ncbi:MAG: copper transporter [Nocardioidaceae bacterium]|nr:copper transporter [Nocardioidaceae bacterium]